MSTDLTFFTIETVEIIQTFPERLNFPISQPLSDQLPGEFLQPLTKEIEKRIYQALPEKSKKTIHQPVADELNIGKQQTLSVELVISPESLLTHFTFTHFAELIKINDPLKRAFYDKEAIMGQKEKVMDRQFAQILIENRSDYYEFDKLMD